jgi:hypothetical protein
LSLTNGLLSQARKRKSFSAFNAYERQACLKGGEQGAVYINQFQMDASPATHDFAVFYKDASAAEATMDAPPPRE